MSGHTPGPWSLRRTIYFLTVVAKGGKRGWRSICQLAYCEGRDGANARLIAAAPELLKALKNMVREWIEIVGDEDVNGTPADTLERAKAAIAKAEAPHA